MFQEKLSLRIFSVLLLAVMVIAILLVGCDGSGMSDSDTTDAGTDGIPAPTEYALFSDGKPAFTVVRDEFGEDDTKQLIFDFRKQLNTVTGATFPLATDWDGNNDNSARAEILVGNTNRPQTAAAISGLSSNDYVVAVIDNKIVIWGGTPSALSQAMQYFLENLVAKAPSDTVVHVGYRYQGTRAALTMDPSKIYTAKQISRVTNSSGADKEFLFKNTAYANDACRFADGSTEMIYKFDLTGKIDPSVTITVAQAYTIQISGDNQNYRLYYNSPSGAERGTYTIKPYEYNYFDTLYIRLTDPTPETGGGAAISSFQFLYYEEGEDKDNAYYLEESVKEIVQQLSTAIPATPVEGYKFHADGGMIYNPISDEKADQLGKYESADCYTGTLELDAGTLTYRIPKQVTAYDAIPIFYTLTPKRAASKTNPIHISATSFEDLLREGGEIYYDLNLPGKIDVTFTYDGYYAGTVNAAQTPNLSMDFKSDKLPSTYPDYTASELIRSGTVDSATWNWFQFTYTNTGNTVLDGNGNGAFGIYPRLYKKDGSGNYVHYSDIANAYLRPEDEIYPGESETICFPFPIANLPAGDYYIELNGYARYENNDPTNFGRTIWTGDIVSRSVFYFKVAASPADTEPSEIQKLTPPVPTIYRNNWLHTYEEYLSSYQTHTKLTKDTPVSEVLYLQCAPWTNQVVLKVLDGNTEKMVGISIPVEVESDSITVTFNPDNENYVEIADGVRYPALMAQSMADMRINICSGPDAAANITEYILKMKDVGINLVNSTACFMYDNGVGGQAFAFSMDLIRKIPGMKMEGFAIYPYYSPSALGLARKIDPSLSEAGSITSTVLGKAIGLLGNYNFKRWGDAYWVVGGKTVISLEDTRGGTFIGTGSTNSMEERSHVVMDEQSLYNFRVFCQSLYGTIDELNKAWGSKYTTFFEINPYDSCSNKTKSIFGSWTRALSDLDSFRTMERVVGYEAMTEQYGDLDLVYDLRLEGSVWYASVPADTANPRYRHVYYDQRANAIIPEILNLTGNIQYMSTYIWDAYRPSEVYELTKSSIENGIVPAHMPVFCHMREIAINAKYGYDFSDLYNISGSESKALQINTTISVFEWWKATYEAGGVPAILWSDYTTDGYATSMQKKDIAFFASKLAEAMESDEAQAWMTDFENDQSDLEKSNAVYTYDEEFIQACIDAYYASKES